MAEGGAVIMEPAVISDYFILIIMTLHFLLFPLNACRRAQSPRMFSYVLWIPAYLYLWIVLMV